jgi:hypothetical protein
MSASHANKPLHMPFSWLADEIKHDENAKFAEKVLIIARGAQTVVSILQSNLDDLASIADGNDTQPLLSAYEVGALAGLMLVSLTSLTGDAERRITAIGAAARKGEKS